MTTDGSHGSGPVWDDRPWPPLPLLRERVEAGVCVVGLGASGLTAIGELLDLGVNVIGIDAAGVGSAAAGRNGGFLLAGTADFFHHAAAQMGADRAAALYRLTLDQLDRIWLETPQAVRRTGTLRIAVDRDEIEDCRVQMVALRQANLPVQPYNGREGPGLLFPMDASSQPLRRCRVLAGRARMRGARLYEHSPAIQIAGDRVVTPHGDVRCDAVIVAVDGGIERVLPELAGRARTARLQVVATAPAPEVDVPRPVYTRWGLEYWQQLPDKRVVLGGFRDLGGDREWTDQAMPTGPVQDELEIFLRRGIGVRAPITHRWAGVIAYTDDKLPIIEQVRDRVWAAGAYSGTGNVLGAVCGRALAQTIVTGRSLLDGVLLPSQRATTGLSV